MDKKKKLELIESWTKEGVSITHARFEEHVSEAFLVAYFTRGINMELRKASHAILSQVAYDQAVVIFESLLEYGCKVSCNGHHVAQDFARHFPDISFDKLGEEVKKE